MSSQSYATFDADLNKFAKAIDTNLRTVVRKVSMDCLKGIVEKMPVDTGRARSGWDLTIGSPSDFLPPEGPGMSAAGVIAKGMANAVGIDGTQQVWIMNNLPYIERLEMGHSKQAPAGMVRQTMAAVAARIEITMEKME